MTTKKRPTVTKKRSRAWLKGLREARAAHAQVAALLLRYPNVLTVGVGAPEKRGRRGDQAAIIVGVRDKQPMSQHETIPRELLGVRIDVKEVSPAKLTRGTEVRAGMQCRGAGREEFGYLGVVGRLPDGNPAALTALHVLVDETLGTDVDKGDFSGTIVEAFLPGTSFTRVGVLARGAFNAREDLALVRLDADVTPSSLLAGSTIALGAPVALTDGLGPVQLLAPGGPFDGALEELHVAGTFDTAGGPQMFYELAKFSIQAPEIREGWCGSPICTQGKRAPVGLLSFGSAGGDAFAYAFPLAPHWQAWGLGAPKGGGS